MSRVSARSRQGLSLYGVQSMSIPLLHWQSKQDRENLSEIRVELLGLQPEGEEWRHQRSTSRGHTEAQGRRRDP